MGGRYRRSAWPLPRAACDTSALGVFTASWLTETFADGRINADWDEDGRQIADLDLPEMTGGANPGDCRALYYLVRRLKPQRILEIGTHLGCSTVTQAMAVARNRADGIAATLDTVDIRDVNDPQMRPGWSSSPLTRLARTSRPWAARSSSDSKSGGLSTCSRIAIDAMG